MKYFSLAMMMLTSSFLTQCSETTAIDLRANNVLGISSGDKEGSGLTGEYATLIKYLDNGCDSFSQLRVPKKGETATINIDVVQDGGVISFSPLLANLRGGVNFDNRFNTGGSVSLSRGDYEDNILSLVIYEGEFKDANEFEGLGTQRFSGRIGEIEVDCSINFIAEGIRK